MACAHKPTPQATLLATNLGNQGIGLGSVSNVFDWLVERFGPALSEILLDLLMKKSQHGVLPTSQDTLGAFDVKGLLVALLERFGPALIEEGAKMLDARTDVLSKLAASILRQYSAQALAWLIQWLYSAAGTQALQSAIAQTVKP